MFCCMYKLLNDEHNKLIKPSTTSQSYRFLCMMKTLKINSLSKYTIQNS